MNKKAKKIYNENWKLCHEVVDERDGRKCVICEATEHLQLDHCITRSKKSVFYEIDLLNYLCSKCHTTKSFQHGCPLDKKVDLITIKRIGKRRYNELLAQAGQTCGGWGTIWYQEECNDLLKDQLEYYKKRCD